MEEEQVRVYTRRIRFVNIKPTEEVLGQEPLFYFLLELTDFMKCCHVSITLAVT